MCVPQLHLICHNETTFFGQQEADETSMCVSNCISYQVQKSICWE